MSKPNPFDDPSNPFEDPSITSALTSQREEPAYQLETDPITVRQFSAQEEIDPFSSTDGPFSHSNVSTPTPGPLPGSREEELLRKERELEQRERDLEQRQMNISRQGRLPNNFPPCFPFIYLDINVEIPPQHQGVMTWLYREWLLFEITLVLNFIACLCVLFSHPPSVTSAPTDMGVALTEMFTHTAASFFLWYRPVYNAYMKDVSLYFCKCKATNDPSHSVLATNILSWLSQSCFLCLTDSTFCIPFTWLLEFHPRKLIMSNKYWL